VRAPKLISQLRVLLKCAIETGRERSPQGGGARWEEGEEGKGVTLKKSNKPPPVLVAPLGAALAISRRRGATPIVMKNQALSGVIVCDGGARGGAPVEEEESLHGFPPGVLACQPKTEGTMLPIIRLSQGLARRADGLLPRALTLELDQAGAVPAGPGDVCPQCARPSHRVRRGMRFVPDSATVTSEHEHGRAYVGVSAALCTGTLPLTI